MRVNASLVIVHSKCVSFQEEKSKDGVKRWMSSQMSSVFAEPKSLFFSLQNHCLYLMRNHANVQVYQFGGCLYLTSH